MSDLGKKKEAIDCFNQAIKLRSDNADAYNNKGNALRHLGNNKEAIDCYDKAIKLQPDLAYAYNGKGNALL